jgi:hypothetical protein
MRSAKNGFSAWARRRKLTGVKDHWKAVSIFTA